MRQAEEVMVSELVLLHNSALIHMPTGSDFKSEVFCFQMQTKHLIIPPPQQIVTFQNRKRLLKMHPKVVFVEFYQVGTCSHKCIEQLCRYVRTTT